MRAVIAAIAAIAACDCISTVHVSEGCDCFACEIKVSLQYTNENACTLCMYLCTWQFV